MDTSAVTGGRNEECEATILLSTGPIQNSAAQAASLSSLDEIAPGLAKRTRRRPTLDRQHSDSSNWTICGEDGGSERVRFDDRVSFIEAEQETGVASSRGAWRKRNKDSEPDIESQKSSR